MNFSFPLCNRQYFLSIILALAIGQAQAQITVFSDNYNRTTLNPAPNGASYTTTATGDGGASIVGNILTLTNDASANANANGKVSLAIATGSFLAPYNSTLSLDGSVTWTFNMQQIRADPSGFAAGNYGVAFVLAGSSSDFTTGNGYAVVLGESGAIDPVRLISYTGGLATGGIFTSVVTGTGAFADVGSDYLSVKVTYAAATNTWTLFGRDDGASTFTDPTTGVLTSFGSGVNSTYTGTPLTSLGELWNFSTAANQTAKFDNVSIVVPEPSAWLAGALALGAIGSTQRRRLRTLLRRAA